MLPYPLMAQAWKKLLLSGLLTGPLSDTAVPVNVYLCRQPGKKWAKW